MLAPEKKFSSPFSPANGSFAPEIIAFQGKVTFDLSEFARACKIGGLLPTSASRAR